MFAYNENTISDQIHTKWAGKTVHFAKETDSTNLWIKRLAKEGAPQGTLALAEFQSAGRGRLGRSWEVPEGTSVMMSILLRPEFEPQYAPMLTLVMGMAVAKAVKLLGFEVSIKWPNDVVVSHKKICGILTEMGVRDGKIDYAVIGVGINVNIREFPAEMEDKATSLYLESGREFDRSQIPGLVMEAFENARNQMNTTVFMVTHDSFFASFCDRVILLKDGMVFRELEKNGNRSSFHELLLTTIKEMSGDIQ